MFKKTHMMVLESEKNVDLIMKIAANNDLRALYKIGVYGKERQNEMYIIGRAYNYHKFKKELANATKDEKGVS